MSDSMLLFVCPLVGYLLGTIPTGLLIGLSQGIDVRTRGSGNIGATNVARVIGAKWGMVTLVADMLKGLVPVLLARYLAANTGMGTVVVSLTGFFAVAGHCFSAFLGFRGGKGVATAVGVFLATCPLAVAGAFLVFFASMKKWSIVSVASLLSSLSMPIFIYFICPVISFEIMALAIAAVIWFKHTDNIKRLLQGTEKRFRDGGKGSAGGEG